MDKLHIDIWSDFCCPYCVLAEKRLERAIAALHCTDAVSIEMHSFELDPYAGTTEPILSSYMRKYNLTEQKALNYMAKMKKTAAEDGADFSGYDKAQAANTFTAHRLAKYAETCGKNMWETLFAAYFRDGLDLADTKTLVQLGASVGLDAGDVEHMLAGNAFADEVRADERTAAEYGVHGVPFFLFANKYSLEGAMPYESFEHGLKAVLARENIEIPAPPKGAVCGPDGCTLG